MKKITFILIGCLLTVLPLFSMFDDYEVSVQGRAMSGAMTSFSRNYDAMFYNPAGLAMARTELGTSYSNYFGSDFATLNTFGFVMPSKSLGSFGLGYQSMSVEYEDVNLMSEKTYALSHAICLNKDVLSELYLGYTANIYNLSYDGMGSQTALGINLGAMAVIHNRTNIGFMVTNLNNPKMGEENDYSLPQRLCAGISYIPYQGVITAFDIKKNWNGDSEYHFGTEVEVHPMLVLRAGVRNNPSMYSAGASIRVKNINVDYGFSYHAVLNPTHHFGLSYKFD